MSALLIFPSLFFPQISEIYDSLPDRPETLNSNGLIMHLVSNKKGKVSKINHIQEINEMKSVRFLEIEAKVGDQVVETVNIRTDSGYVLLENIDSDALLVDYNRILVLQETMFEVEVEVVDDKDETNGVQGGEAPAVPVSKSRRRRRAHAADLNSVRKDLPEQREALGEDEQSSQQENSIQSFEAQPLHQQQQQQKQATSSHVAALLAQLKQKLSKVAVRASAILAGYCVAFYAAAIVLPFIF